MAHFALLDENNMVIHVCVVDNVRMLDENGIEQESLGLAHLKKNGFEGRYVQTSFNTIAGQHILGGEPIRQNFAGTGSYYDEERDAFYNPNPKNPNLVFDERGFWYDPTKED